MTEQRFTILSVEDSEADFLLLQKALDRVPNLLVELINVQDGQKASDFLHKRGNYKSAPSPNIIILDINLPKIDGFDILKIIKSNDDIKMIPVIIFSTSDSEKDIKESYQLNANTYITKTFDLEELYSKITIVAEYWFKTAELPPTSNFCFVNKSEDTTKKEEK